MALAVAFFSRAAKAEPDVALPRDGVLVIGQLRGEGLTIHDFEDAPGARELLLPGPPHEMVAVDGRLYVTLGRGNAVAEIDPLAPGVLRVLRLEGEPHGIAAAGDKLFVTLDRGDALVTVELPAFVELSRSYTGDTPHTVAGAGSTAFVTDSRDNRIEAMGAMSGSAATGSLPEAVAVVGNLVLTADYEGGTLSLFSTPGLQSAGRVALGGHPVRILQLDGERVAVALNDSSQVAIVNLRNLKVERRVKVLGRPDGLCLNPGGTHLAVVSNEANAVQVFELSTWRLATTLDAGSGPGQCAWLAHH
jgi:DNA-binding beta-propeller fold protein YncE